MGYTQSGPEKFANASNRYSIELFELLAKSQPNLFCSPFSIRTVLSMTFAGAHNETKTEMAKVFGFDASDSTYHQQTGFFLEALKTWSASGSITLGNTKFNLVNQIYFQDSMSILPPFVAIQLNDYKSAIQVVDFKLPENREKSRMQINLQVAEQTDQLIPELIGSNILNEETRMCLINALLLKAAWDLPFDSTKTRKDQFLGRDKTNKKVDFMARISLFPYFENADLQWIEVPLQAHKFSMVIVLPSTNKKLAGLHFTADTLKYFDEQAQNLNLALSIPKFSQASDIELGSAYTSAGLKNPLHAFTDFSGINGAKNLQIGSLIHKARFQNDEKGLSAAAASAAVLTRKSMIVNENPEKEVKVNRPFMFYIKENQFNTILFIGQINNL